MARVFTKRAGEGQREVKGERKEDLEGNKGKEERAEKDPW